MVTREGPGRSSEQVPRQKPPFGRSVLSLRTRTHANCRSSGPPQRKSETRRCSYRSMMPCTGGGRRGVVPVGRQSLRGRSDELAKSITFKPTARAEHRGDHAKVLSCKTGLIPRYPSLTAQERATSSSGILGCMREPRAAGDLVHVEKFFARNPGGLIRDRQVCRAGHESWRRNFCRSCLDLSE
jgi:hypothetical protein